jgi:hypothetical protein
MNFANILIIVSVLLKLVYAGDDVLGVNVQVKCVSECIKEFCPAFWGCLDECFEGCPIDHDVKFLEEKDDIMFLFMSILTIIICVLAEFIRRESARE